MASQEGNVLSYTGFSFLLHFTKKKQQHKLRFSSAKFYYVKPSAKGESTDVEDVHMGVTCPLAEYLVLFSLSVPIPSAASPTSDVHPPPVLGEAFPSIHPGAADIGGWGQPRTQLTVLSGPGVETLAPTGLGSLLCFFKYL